MGDSVATLVVDVNTKPALDALTALEKKMREVGVTPINLNGEAAAQQLKTLAAEFEAFRAKAQNATSDAAEGMLKFNAAINGIGKGSTIAADGLNPLILKLDALKAEAIALSTGGFDLSAMVKGQALAQQETEGTIRSLSSLIRKLEQVDAVVKQLGTAGITANDTILQKFAVDATALAERLAAAKAALAQLQQQAAQGVGDSLNETGGRTAQMSRILELEREMVALVKEENRLHALNIAGTQEAERAKALALEQQITTQMVAQAEARALNVAGTQEAERAKALALEQQITAQMVAQAESRALNVAGTQEAERAKALALEQQITAQMVAQAEARALNVAGTQEAERQKALALEAQITAQMVAQAEARALNVAGTQEAERQKVLAAEKQITQELKLQREYILATDKQRVQSALEARKLMDAGYAGNLTTQFAPQTLSLASGSSVAALNTQLVALEAAQKAAAAATNTSATHLTHWNKIANEAHAAARGLSGSLGGLWLTYGSIAPLLAAAAIAGSMKQVFTVGKDLEYQFTMISAISQGTTVDLEKFNEAVRGTAFTPIEAAKGLRVLAQAGLEVSEAVIALPSILKLAAIGETDMGTAALASTAIMHAFGLSVADFGHIGDVFGKAAAVSATSVTGLMEAMRQATSISVMYGTSLEETAAALATLANRGIERSAAGTALTNMVREMSSPATQKAAEAMKRYGIEATNADGTTKSLTEKLQQLAYVASTMSAGARTRWLEDMFNARGVKAASILLSDMGKLKELVQELRDSSEGLGFMNEASIKLSLSVEGGLNTLKGDFQRALNDVFISVQPSIQSFIATLSSAVNSTEFKSALESTANAVIYLTKALVENIDVVKNLAGAYIAFKGFTLMQAGLTLLLPVLAGVRVALVAISAPLLALGSNVATLGLVSGAVTTLSSTFGVAAAAAATLIAPVTLLTAAVVAVGYAAYKVYDALFNMTGAQQKAADESTNYAEANRRIVTELDKGIEALRKDNIALDEQIRLMRMGASEADAYAASLRKVPLALAQTNVAEAKTSYLKAQSGLEAIPKVNFGAGVPLLDPFAKERNGAQQALEKTQDNLLAAQADYSKAVIANGVALETAKAGTAKRAQVAALTSAQAQNARLVEIEKSGIDAIAALNRGGLNKEATKTLKDLVEMREKASKLKPVPDGKGGTSTASASEVLALKTQIDSLKNDSYKSAPAAKSGSNPALKTEALTGRANAAVLEYQQSLQKGELDLLKSSQQSKLISEETYRADLVAIYDKYSDKISKGYDDEAKRLESAVKNSTGDQQRVAEIAYEKLKKTQADYLQGKELALKKSLDNEEKLSREAWAATNKLIAEQEAVTERAKEKFRAARLKLDMTPEQAAYYDASTASQAGSDKNIADATSKLETLRNTTDDKGNRVYAETSRQIQDQIAMIDKLIAKRAELSAQAGVVAAQEVEYNRSFESGTKSAFRSYIDAATDTATQTRGLFTDAFKGIEDALVTFVTNGKLDFKSLTESILADLARMQIKGLMSSVMDIFSKALTPAGGADSGSSGFLGNGITLRAKGEAFDGSASLHRFVNTVQTSPQYFTANAKGNIFAEAGPEAVMPLTRDAQGQLGVKAQGGGYSGGGTPNISLVINNTVSDKVEATAQPRMNNGKMEIEVMIQQAINKDLRNNGPITQGLTGTFGLARAV